MTMKKKNVKYCTDSTFEQIKLFQVSKAIKNFIHMKEEKRMESKVEVEDDNNSNNNNDDDYDDDNNKKDQPNFIDLDYERISFGLT